MTIRCFCSYALYELQSLTTHICAIRPYILQISKLEHNKLIFSKVPTLRFKNYDDNYREITLKDVCTLITKGTTPAKFSTNGINFIKIDSLNGNYVDNSKVTHINESIHNTLLSRSILEENDILLAIAGATVGKHCIIQKSNLPANTNQALAIIRLNKHLLPYYLLAFFDTNYLPSYIKLICAASAQPNLNLQQVGQIKLNIPTIQEQEKVCHFIQLLDKRISVQNKIIKHRKSLIFSLVIEILLSFLSLIESALSLNVFSFFNNLLKFMWTIFKEVKRLWSQKKT